MTFKRLAVVLLLPWLLAACGGTAGSSSSSSSTVTITGTASDTDPSASAPLHAPLRVASSGGIDSATVQAVTLGGVVEATGTTDSSGAYSLSVTPGVDYVVRITKGNVMMKALLLSPSSNTTVAVNPRSSATVRALGENLGSINLGEAGTDVSSNLGSASLSTLVSSIEADGSFNSLVATIVNDILTNGDYNDSGGTTNIGVGNTGINIIISVTVSNGDSTAPSAPTVTGITPTADSTPTWSWSGSGGGIGFYRYKLDNSDLTSGATTVYRTASYTPTSALSVGTHTLYVQERDSASNWSATGSKSVVITSSGPTITSRSPSAEAVSASTSTTVTATFSEAMNSGTITTSTFTLYNGSTQVSGTVSYDSGTKTATFSPSATLTDSVLYTVSLSGSITSSSGTAIIPVSYGFITTGSPTRVFCSSEDDIPQDMAIDSAGNLYIVGLTYGAIDGNISAGGADIFLVKYNSAGVKQWTKQVGTSIWDNGTGVAIDSSDNVYITGSVMTDFDGLAVSGRADAFVIKYNSSGTKLWTKLYGSAGTGASVTGISIDSSDNIYLGGFSYSGDLYGNVNVGIDDIFLMKLNSSGTRLWTSTLGTIASDVSERMITDSSGNSYLVGQTKGDLDGNTNQGSYDVFVTKFNSSGTKQWARLIGSTGLENAVSVALDSSGNLYLTGSTNGSFDGQTQIGTWDIFLTKYNSSGTKQWTKVYGASDAGGLKVIVDSSDNIFIAGYTRGGMYGNSGFGFNDVFLMKLDSSGTRTWTKQIGTSNTDVPTGLVLDSSGNIFVSGGTRGVLDGLSVQGGAEYCGFVTKFDSNGDRPGW